MCPGVCKYVYQEGGGSPVCARQDYRVMCPPGPNAREPPWREKQAWCGHPAGARPCLVNEEGQRSDPQSLVGPGRGVAPEPSLWQGHWLDPQGLQEGQTGPGCGGPDTGGPGSSSSQIAFWLPSLCSCPSLALANVNFSPRPGGGWGRGKQGWP